MMERDVTVTYVVVDDVWRACFGTADSVAAAVASLPGLPGGWALAPMSDGFAVAAHEGVLLRFATEQARTANLEALPRPRVHTFRADGDDAWCLVDGSSARRGSGAYAFSLADNSASTPNARMVVVPAAGSRDPHVVLQVAKADGVPERRAGAPRSELALSELCVRHPSAFQRAFEQACAQQPSAPPLSVWTELALVAAPREPPSWTSACAVCGIADVPLVQSSHHWLWLCNHRRGADASSCAVEYFLASPRDGFALGPSTRHIQRRIVCAWSGESDPFRLYIVLHDERSRIFSRSVLASGALPLVAVASAVPVICQGIINEWLVPSGVNTTDPLAELGVAVPLAQREGLCFAVRHRTSTRATAVGPLVLRDRFHHWLHFKRLLCLAFEGEQRELQRAARHGVAVRWDQLGARHAAYFTYNQNAVDDLSVRDFVLLSQGSEDSAWSARARVFVLMTEGIVGALLENDTDVDDARVGITEGYSVLYLPSTISVDRQQTAIFRMAVDEFCVSPVVRELLLGHRVDARVLPVPALPDLTVASLPPFNEDQRGAIRMALLHRVSLVQGPPGTGKTDVVAGVCNRLLEMHVAQVLVVAPSNDAATQAARKISRTGCKVFRFYARSREAPADLERELRLAAHAEPSSYELLCQIDDFETQLKEAQLRLTRDDRVLREECLQRALDSVDVIVCTCSTAMDPYLTPRVFKAVVIDEAGQCLEPDGFIPVLMGAQRVVLIGDHQQLSPAESVKSDEARAAGLGVSIFERLMRAGNVPSCMLRVQYRMHPAISEFPSTEFYADAAGNRKVVDGVTAADRTFPLSAFPWPNPEQPAMFLHVAGEELRPPGGTSYYNSREAVVVCGIVAQLQRAGAKATDIGIITPYAAQRSEVYRRLREATDVADAAEVEVANIDGYQGREKVFIVISCVRSNQRQEVGFFSRANRLNVALTRARSGLVIVGNIDTFKKHTHWRSLARSYQQRGLMRTGSPVAPGAFSVRLPEPFTEAEDATLDAVLQTETPVAAVAALSLPMAEGYDVPAETAADEDRVAAFCVEFQRVADSLVAEGQGDSLALALALLHARESEGQSALAAECFAVAAVAEGSSLAASQAPARARPLLCNRYWSQFRLLACLWRARAVGYLDCRQLVQYWRFARQGRLKELHALCRDNRYERGRLPGLTGVGAALHAVAPPDVSRRSLGRRWIVADDAVRAARDLRDPTSCPQLSDVLAMSLLDSRGGIDVTRAVLEARFPPVDVRTALLVGDTVFAAVPTYLLDRRLPGRGLTFNGAVYRMVRAVRCKYGALWALGLMATIADFSQQRRNFQRVLEWYMRSVRVVRARFPEATVLLPFCSPGGHAEGCARVDLDGAGIDNAEQLSDAVGWFSHVSRIAYPMRRARITVTRGDALSMAVRDGAVSAHPCGGDHLATVSTPPCGPQSTLQHLLEDAVAARTAAEGNSLLEDIALNESRYRRSRVPWMSETTANPSLPTPEGVARVAIASIWAGLRTHDRHWIYCPPLHPLIVDASLSTGGRWLAQHSCTGADKALAGRHPHGAAVVPTCCEGILCACWNAATCKYSLSQVRHMLEVHDRHVTSRQRVNDLLPPPVGSLLAAQVAMHALNLRLAVPCVSFDEALADRVLAVWHDAVLDGFSLPELPQRAVAARRGVRWACVLCVPLGGSPPCLLLTVGLSVPVVVLDPTDGRPLCTRVVSALAETCGLEVPPSRLQFVCDFDVDGDWCVVFHLPSLDLARRSALRLSDASSTALALASPHPAAYSASWPPSAHVLALVPVPTYLASLARVARTVERSQPTSCGAFGLAVLWASRLLVVDVDLEGDLKVAGLSSLASDCYDALPFVFCSASQRAEADALARRFEVLPVPVGDSVRLPSVEDGGGKGRRDTATVDAATVSTYPPLAPTMDGRDAPLAAASLRSVKLPRAADRRETYIKLRKRIVTSRSADDPGAFGLGGKKHPDSDEQKNNSGFVKPVDKAVVALLVRERVEGKDDRFLVFSTGARQFGFFASLFRAPPMAADDPSAYSKEHAAIRTELEAALLQLLPAGVFSSTVVTRMRECVGHVEPSRTSWLVASRDEKGERPSTAVAPIKYDLRLWTVTVAPTLAAEDEALRPYFVAATASAAEAWCFALEAGSTEAGSTEAGVARNLTITEPRMEAPPLAFQWMTAVELARHFQSTGRGALAACIQASETPTQTADAAMAVTLRNARQKHSFMRSLRDAEAKGHVKLMRYVAARQTVSADPWVDVFFDKQQFHKLTCGQVRVLLRANSGVYAAAREGTWLRARSGLEGHCAWFVVSWVRRYRSFSEAVFSRDFDPFLLGMGPLDSSATRLSEERRFYVLNCAREREQGMYSGAGRTQAVKTAARWGALLGTRNRVLCWGLNPAPSQVHPPGARFQIRTLDEPVRRLDVRSAWRSMARVLGFVRSINRRRVLCSSLSAVRSWRHLALRLSSVHSRSGAAAFVATASQPRSSLALRQLVQKLLEHRCALVKSSVVGPPDRLLRQKHLLSVVFYYVVDGAVRVWSHVHNDGSVRALEAAIDSVDVGAVDEVGFSALASSVILPLAWTRALESVQRKTEQVRMALEFDSPAQRKQTVRSVRLVELSRKACAQYPEYRASCLAKVRASSMQWRSLEEAMYFDRLHARPVPAEVVAREQLQYWSAVASALASGVQPAAAPAVAENVQTSEQAEGNSELSGVRVTVRPTGSRGIELSLAHADSTPIARPTSVDATGASKVPSVIIESEDDASSATGSQPSN
ncbi:MAG: hypothetical protein CBB71_23335 [Rhodopirellula sp. TMED11]|nr:MAG: hypothetical protein CBB71_23335 [Rhodopirellula sp. TMED11]